MSVPGLLSDLTFKSRQEAVDLYRQMAGTGLTSNDVKEIVPAAYYGRVEICLLSRAPVMGRF